MGNVRKIKTFVDVILCKVSIVYFLTRLKCKLNDIAMIQHGNEQSLLGDDVQSVEASGVVAGRH